MLKIPKSFGFVPSRPIGRQRISCALIKISVLIMMIIINQCTTLLVRMRAVQPLWELDGTWISTWLSTYQSWATQFPFWVFS